MRLDDAIGDAAIAGAAGAGDEDCDWVNSRPHRARRDAEPGLSVSLALRIFWKLRSDQLNCSLRPGDEMMNDLIKMDEIAPALSAKEAEHVITTNLPPIDHHGEPEPCAHITSTYRVSKR